MVLKLLLQFVVPGIRHVLKDHIFFYMDGKSEYTSLPLEDVFTPRGMGV